MLAVCYAVSNPPCPVLPEQGTDNYVPLVAFGSTVEHLEVMWRLDGMPEGAFSCILFEVVH